MLAAPFKVVLDANVLYPFTLRDTLLRAASQGLQAAAFLDRNDSYGYFHALGDLLVTGPTHTNVNDFRAILVL